MDEPLHLYALPPESFDLVWSEGAIFEVFEQLSRHLPTPLHSDPKSISNGLVSLPNAGYA